jgi:hypothetical protein
VQHHQHVTASPSALSDAPKCCSAIQIILRSQTSRAFLEQQLVTTPHVSELSLCWLLIHVCTRSDLCNANMKECSQRCPPPQNFLFMCSSGGTFSKPQSDCKCITPPPVGVVTDGSECDAPVPWPLCFERSSLNCSPGFALPFEAPCVQGLILHLGFTVSAHQALAECAKHDCGPNSCLTTGRRSTSRAVFG